MRHLASIILALSLTTGCATAPGIYTYDKTREINAPKDIVWTRIIGNFAANNVPIKTIEKASGIIYAESRLAKPSYKDKGKIFDWADCGIDPLSVPIEREVSYNVFVHEEKPNATKVTINTRFKEIRQLAVNNTITSLECNSTGNLEKAMLDVASGILESVPQ